MEQEHKRPFWKIPKTWNAFYERYVNFKIVFLLSNGIYVSSNPKKCKLLTYLIMQNQNWHKEFKWNLQVQADRVVNCSLS